MKKILLLSVAILIYATSYQALSQVSASVDINTFNTTLSPYGRWVDDPNYGRVWIYNEPGFRPYYSNGHWEYTDDGWAWVSDYPWGWAPFHYGRWAFINGYGWGWAPGYDWAPAWVSWSSYGDYYGWAPLGPGLGIDISIGSIPEDRWCFVPRRYITSRSIHSYYLSGARGAAIYRHAAPIRNEHGSHNAGPRREEVERVTHTRVAPRQIPHGRAVAGRPAAHAVGNSHRNIAASHSAGGRMDKPRGSIGHNNVHTPNRQPEHMHAVHPMNGNFHPHDNGNRVQQRPETRMQAPRPEMRTQAPRPQHMNMGHASEGHMGGGNEHHEGRR